MKIDPADEKHRYCIQLYNHVLGENRLTGLDVLEVGCGKGGGAVCLMKYDAPRSLAAMDLSSRAILSNKKSYAIPDLTFHKGDAENIPFSDASFDAVVNIESSHCYPRVDRFLDEVDRVLRRGGRFFYADFRRKKDLARWEREILDSPLALQEKEDITSGVVRALTLDSGRKETMIHQRVPPLFRSSFRQFSCTAGSANYNSLLSGERLYYRYLLAKK